MTTLDSKTFQVPNIGCDGCVRTIKNEVGSINGVKRVEADVSTRQVTVVWDVPATWQEIDNKLREIDYAPAQ